MRYTEIMEAKSPKAREAILKNFGEKMDERIAEDNRFTYVDSDAVLTNMERQDPTPNSEFVNWILREYLAGRLRYLEDIPKVTAPLTRFVELKPKLPADQRDIQKYKFLELIELVKSHEDTDTMSNNAKERELEQKMFSNEEAILVRNNAEWKIVIPKTERASCYFGVNTQWCTAAENDNMFDTYNESGDLYIVLHKPTNRRWQLHFEDSQFMDENDNEIEDHALLVKLIKLIKPNATPLELVSLWGELITQFPNASEEVQIAAVKNMYTAITLIDNPSVAVQIAAVEDSHKAVTLLNNPSEEVVLAAIKANTFALHHITDPTEEMIAAAIHGNPTYAIQILGADATHHDREMARKRLAQIKKESDDVLYGDRHVP